MKPIDWLNILGYTIAVFWGVTILWSIVQGVRIHRNVRKRRLQDLPPPADPPLRYSDFEAADRSACCTTVQTARDQWNITWLECSWGGRLVQKVYLNYCPQCGRKLKVPGGTEL